MTRSEFIRTVRCAFVDFVDALHRDVDPARDGGYPMTRQQQRLAARHRRALQTGVGVQAAQDALLGDALYRRNQARMTPTDRACRDQGLRVTAMQAARQGIDFIDFYVAVFRCMPRLI